MKKIYNILFLVLVLTSCDKTQNDALDQNDSLVQNDSIDSDIQDKIENLILIGTESKTDRDGYDTVFDFVNLIYDSNNNLKNYNLEIPKQINTSIDFEYSGNNLIQFGDYSVEYGENQITLNSADRREEYFLDNDKIVLYKWYQFDNEISEFELFVSNEFTYGEDFKNVIRIDEFDSNGELIRYATFEYDNNLNPYKNLDGVLNIHPFLNLDILKLNSENNVVRSETFRKFNSEFITSTTNITYTYNDQNYPTNLELVQAGFSIERNFIYQE